MGTLKDTIEKYVDLALPSGTKWASDYLRDKDGNVLYFPSDCPNCLCGELRGSGVLAGCHP